MAKANPAAPETAQRLEVGNLGAAQAATAGAFKPIGRFNIEVRGVFVGTVVLDRSFDGGTNWTPAGGNGAVVGWALAMNEQAEHSGEPDVLYRLRMAAYASGAAIVRLSQ